MSIETVLLDLVLFEYFIVRFECKKKYASHYYMPVRVRTLTVKEIHFSILLSHNLSVSAVTRHFVLGLRIP